MANPTHTPTSAKPCVHSAADRQNQRDDALGHGCARVLESARNDAAMQERGEREQHDLDGEEGAEFGGSGTHAVRSGTFC